MTSILWKQYAPGEAHPGLFAGLAEQINDAADCGTAGPVRVLAGELVELLADRMSVCRPEVRAAIVGAAGSDEALRQAFELGRLAFAQLLTATVSARRPEDAFYAVFADPEYAECLGALAKGEISSDELGFQLSDTTLGLARKLIYLRSLGIAEFRSLNGVTMNFLTPAAQAWVLAHLN